MKPIKTQAATQAGALARQGVSFRVDRRADGLFLVMAGNERLGEPTVFEALAYQYLAGQVLRYWELECVSRASPDKEGKHGHAPSDDSGSGPAGMGRAAQVRG